MNINTILDQVDLGAMALPTFQRGYVWNRDQVRGLMRSLYRKHPVGSLLVWVTKTEEAHVKGDGQLAPGSVKLILDGQQRMTSLYGIVRGHAPRFFEGNTQAFTGLYFNLDDESFEFYAPMKMKDNPLWIKVTEVMQQGTANAIQRLLAIPALQPQLPTYVQRLGALEGIKQTELHIEEVTGEDKTVDVVVEIFNVVNSGGTKLSKGDLALAKVCAQWPKARAEMRTLLNKWRGVGFSFQLDWLMRCVTTLTTGEALFSALKDVDTPAFRCGLKKVEKSVDTLLNMISARLGLDHDRVLGSRYSFPLMVRYLDQCGGRLADYRERDKLLYWYIQTFLWGRYAGSTESVLSQDLRLIQGNDGGALDRLIGQLRQNRGSLRLRPEDFKSWSVSARFYPLLYMLTRVGKAKDWDTGNELYKHLLGKLNQLQLHHVFPRGVLYKHGYTRSEVNAIANFTFLTQETNLLVSDREPAEYLEEFAAKHPGAVESTWIPMDRALWHVENYREFLAARRELMAKAGNEFLDSLLAGSVPEAQVVTPVLERPPALVPGSVEGDEEYRLIQECNDWVIQQGLPAGEITYELADPKTGDPLAILDLAWPKGLQEEYSQPVALLLGEEPGTEAIVSRAGYRCFTDGETLRSYIRREILAMNGNGS